MKTLMGLAGLTMAGFMLLSCNTEVKEANYQIIPLPQEISVMDQAAPFILSNGTKIMYPEGNEKMQKNAEFLASYIKDLTGKSLAVQAGTDGKGIILQLGGNAENPEIFATCSIRSITVVRMEVPCCGGLVQAVQRALTASGAEIPCEVVILSTDGRRKA